jgi:uncharacterized membrane protein YbaN (DUF454 family)
MARIVYLVLGMVSLLLGAIGVVLPLLPTVPFMLLAAFFFARSSPRLEQWLVQHPTFGVHIQAWRTRRAISRKGKRAALVAFGLSADLDLYAGRCLSGAAAILFAGIGCRIQFAWANRERRRAEARRRPPASRTHIVPNEEVDAPRGSG